MTEKKRERKREREGERGRTALFVDANYKGFYN